MLLQLSREDERWQCYWIFWDCKRSGRLLFLFSPFSLSHSPLIKKKIRNWGREPLFISFSSSSSFSFEGEKREMVWFFKLLFLISSFLRRKGGREWGNWNEKSDNKRGLTIGQPSKIAVQKVKKRPEVATSCDRIYKLNVTLREFQKNSVLTLTFL